MLGGLVDVCFATLDINICSGTCFYINSIDIFYCVHYIFLGIATLCGSRIG